MTAVLAFFAHPDDETMLMGGTLALLARAGLAVHYLCATRGEGGEAGEPPLCPRERLGEVRAAELACAVRALGGHSLAFLPYRDPEVGPDGTLYPFADDPDEVARHLLDALERLRPVALITHGSNGEYGHPAHRLCHQAAHRAVQALGPQAPALYTIQAHHLQHPRPRLANADDPAHLVLDITPVLTQKVQAALCHRTQHALFTRHASQEMGRPVSVPEAVTRITSESLHRAYPPGPPGEDDPIAQALAPYRMV